MRLGEWTETTAAEESGRKTTTARTADLCQAKPAHCRFALLPNVLFILRWCRTYYKATVEHLFQYNNNNNNNNNNYSFQTSHVVFTQFTCVRDCKCVPLPRISSLWAPLNYTAACYDLMIALWYTIFIAACSVSSAFRVRDSYFMTLTLEYHISPCVLPNCLSSPNDQLFVKLYYSKNL